MLSSRPQSVAPVAVIGVGCFYPGARDPRQLWENVLARRREFRRIPPQRLSADYYDPDPAAPDRTYARRGAFLDGFSFDPIALRIPQATFESTDVVHWLALHVALQALEDAGYGRAGVPRERTGVVVGNTLTGEYTRSLSMRPRWPFVRRALLAAARERGLSATATDELARTMEDHFKSVFPPMTDDTLAGGLSNTIAGRICNVLDLHGGGYTVDGACASSVLSVITAADHLASRNMDLVLAGGVDVSLDTFELVGFAKVGALTREDMNVYDRRAAGFLPGEGCGFVVLKRLEDALADGDTVYAVLRGWGLSSDGKGGLTTPTREGQATALLRAYEKAGYPASDLDFVEGHGTGTSVGDRVELEAIAAAVESSGPVRPRRCGVTSLKSIIGHTKAAAGIGAVIKAVIALNRRVVPPTAGCETPSEVFDGAARCLYPVLRGEIANPSVRLRAGVSGMGFGGINTHLTLESADPPSPRLAPAVEERALLVSHQETEVFALAAGSLAELATRLGELGDVVEQASLADLPDLAAQLSRELTPGGRVRAAVVAGHPERAAERLRALERRLRESPPAAGDVWASPDQALWVGHAAARTRLGFLFPGQGSQQLLMARTLVERYPWARAAVAKAEQAIRDAGGKAVSEFVWRAADRALDADEA
ncbi:MAG TPA: beta-ketoacyl synthase N-terminal-like domain-containing protein, partial [Gemmatimonadota bacterium]